MRVFDQLISEVFNRPLFHSYTIRRKSDRTHLHYKGKVFTTQAVSAKKAKANALRVMMDSSSDEMSWFFIKHPDEFEAVVYTAPEPEYIAPKILHVPVPRQGELNLGKTFNNAQAD